MLKLDLTIGIREKLFFLILVGFCALILTTFWQIGEQAEEVSGDSIKISLAQSSAVLDAKIESRFNTIKDVAISIAKDGRILPLVYERESLTLQDQSSEFQRKLEFDILFITDDQGTILARSDRPQAIGQNIAGRAQFFDSALGGKSGSGYFMSQGRLMQLVTEPIFDNVVPDLVRGMVVLAYELSSDTANEIVSLTFSDIGFFSFSRNDKRVVDGVQNIYLTDSSLTEPLSKFFDSPSNPWGPIFSSASSVTDFRINLNGREYFAVTKLLANEGSDPLGFVIILRSSSDLLRPFEEIQQTVLVVGSFCLLVAFLMAALFAFQIGRPIRELVSVTSKIREGSFTEIKEKNYSKDEIGTLYRAVFQMGNSLREKADLENYLASISNELNEDDTMPQRSVGDNSLGFDGESLTLNEEVDATSQVSLLRVSEKNKNVTANDQAVVSSSTLIDERYEVIKLIGRGAMGDVFLVYDRVLDERVAIKLLPRELFDRNDASLSMKDEIRLARRVTHRNILRTFDMGTWGEHAYITMEYVQGYDLDLLVSKRGSQKPNIAILLMKQICSAMNAAHEQGIIHLDLKPGNMMVNSQGILKIMDFGLSQSIESEANRNSQAARELVGTPRFMAPEQFLRERLDQRTDIYSIGIIFYTLLAGSPPFSASEYKKLAELHIHADLPPIDSKTDPMLNSLERIISKATAKKPEHRYQTIKEFRESLDTMST